MWLNIVGLLVIFVFSMIAAPLAVKAQAPTKIPRVGILRHDAPPNRFIDDLRQGLHELGYVEGQNLILEFRWAAGQVERLAALAAELVSLPVDVIVTSGPLGVRAAQAATSTMPIVMGRMDDADVHGFVASLAHPGGNVTGQILRDPELAGKRLEMLKDAAPTITHVAVLVDPSGPGSARYPSAFEREARALGVRLQGVEAGTPEAISDALATIARSGADALMVMDSSMFNSHRQRILDFARTHRLPTVCGVRVYAEAGCLMAYAPNIGDMWRRAAIFVDKILKGAKADEIPIELPSKLELVLNLTTAQALGVTFPPTLLFQADEVIR